jgi:hypothetical protein
VALLDDGLGDGHDAFGVVAPCQRPRGNRCVCGIPEPGAQCGIVAQAQQGGFQGTVGGDIEQQRIFSVRQDFADVFGVRRDDGPSELQILEQLPGL